MSALPDWLDHIEWEAPHLMRNLIADNRPIPALPGLYAFNLDAPSLRPSRVLYVGQTTAQGGLRGRMSRDYLHRDPKIARTRHKAALFLQDFRLRNPQTPVYVRWFLFDASAEVQRDIEKGLMQVYMAWFNTMGMRSDTDFETI